MYVLCLVLLYGAEEQLPAGAQASAAQNVETGQEHSFSPCTAAAAAWSIKQLPADVKQAAHLLID